MNITLKHIWQFYSERFGRTIFHPQFIMRTYAYSAIGYARKYVQGDLVDIGCGRMPYKNDLLPLLHSYIGVDHPKIAMLYRGSQKPDILAEAKSLPFKDASFDSVLLLQVLEYIDEPQKVLLEISRILRRNGILILSVPFLYPIHDPPFDMSRYTTFFLKKMLKDSSMRVVAFDENGGILALVFQSITLFILRQFKDSLSERNGLAFVFLIPGMVLLPGWILLGNILVALSAFLPTPQASKYFRLNYTVVARKV